jgi:hypothetical protein
MFKELWHSEQLSFESLFTGISSSLTNPELHLNQLRERGKEQGGGPSPLSLGKAAQPALFGKMLQ